jgi:hypothetical protein
MDELRSRLTGVKLSAFSDTFIISIRGQQKLMSQPRKFVRLLCDALLPAFVRSMDYDFFFRGVIVMDNFSRSSMTLIGPAVDEAANYYEKANWIGISLSPSTRSFLEQDTMIETDSDLTVKYHIPQKPGGSKLTRAVNWIDWDRSHRYRDLLVRKAKFYAHEQDKYTKYQNTMDFYDYCTKRRSDQK